MAKFGVLNNNSRIRLTKIYCESENIKLQCKECKFPLSEVQVSAEGLRYALYTMMYCQQCDMYYIQWDQNNEQ